MKEIKRIETRFFLTLKKLINNRNGMEHIGTIITTAPNLIVRPGSL